MHSVMLLLALSLMANAATLKGQNPVIPVDHPDPHVLRVVENGQIVYFLTATVGSGSDIWIFESKDLITWKQLPTGVFNVTGKPNDSIELNGRYYCAIWAPQMVEVDPGQSYLISFSAQRFDTPRNPCPAYLQDGGVYVASSSGPRGPYAIHEHPWEPIRAGTQISTCPANVANAVPHSVDTASPQCQGGPCLDIIRLDSDVFHDALTNTWWLSYAWYTNSPPLVTWEKTNLGEHVGVVQLTTSDPWAVMCSKEVPTVFAANCHDPALLAKLAAYCPRCGEMLAFDKGRYGENMTQYGYSWCVNEGPNMFRRGNYLYVMISASAYDSAYYQVYWIAAPTVDLLAYTNPSRLAGRYIIPSLNQSFGHGTITIGPDNSSLYFVHHHLNHPPCEAHGNCARDVWVSPIEFEDRHDGLGDVWIVPRFPAENTTFVVNVP